jgi:hypothetical protein
MTQPPFQHAESLRIGTVDFVSPDEIKVVLEIDAPESVALNAGGPRPFPRVNSYVLIPVDDGFLVGQIEWLTIERSAFPKRRGMQDFGLIDLPYPLRKMSLNPLGTLRKVKARHGAESYMFRRGADALPSVGTGVMLPTDKQLYSIVESGERRRVKIGTSPLAGNAEVRIDPDRLFGRHLAVLGNTGSGKSCSVAGLIRWSLEQATPENGKPANARFIVLDPNGEYSRAFTGDKNPALNARVYRAAPSKDNGERPLQVPLWFWNSAEWCSFTQASAKAQRPLLKRALREVKSGRATTAEPTNEEALLGLRRYIAYTMTSIQKDLRAGTIKTEETKFGYRLKAVYEDIEQRKTLAAGVDFDEVQSHISAALNATFNSFNDRSTGKTVEFYRAFTEGQIEAIIKAFGAVLDGLGGVVPLDGPDEDVPLPFDGTSLADHLELLAEQANASQYLEFLIARIRTFLADTRMKAVAGDGIEISLQEWLREYVGGDAANTGCVSVLDLSLVPSEIVHIIAAVVARVVFESLQRYRKLYGHSLPTVLVMEEAHSFVKRYKDDVDNHDAASVCCQVFERIAREGRKFGLGLVLSSQRPAELSPTVLSQCNTYLLHRISNDRDQELVHRLVPDNLRGLLRELPSLPSQNAILLGWATELPVLVRMNDLPRQHQPQSDDPEFWNMWTRQAADGKPLEGEVNWKGVADDWQGKSTSLNEST